MTFSQLPHITLKSLESRANAFAHAAQKDVFVGGNVEELPDGKTLPPPQNQGKPSSLYEKEEEQAVLDTVIDDLLQLNCFDHSVTAPIITSALEYLIDPQSHRLEVIASELHDEQLEAAIADNVANDILQKLLNNLGISSETCSYVAVQWDNLLNTGLKIAMQKKLQDARIASSDLSSSSSTALQVIDVDWSFGVTTGTHLLQKTSRPYVQIKYVVDDGNGGQREIFTEMDQAQFLEFLSQMEEVRGQMDGVTTAE